MKAFRAWFAPVAVAGWALLAFGCENTAQGVKKDAQEAKEEAKEESYEAREAARGAAEEAKEATGEAASKVGGAVKEAGDAMHAAKQTLDVKAALMADTSIDASAIDVDTDHETKTVSLKGTVPTAAQKSAAERVARDKAEGYKIRNLLTVARRP